MSEPKNWGQRLSVFDLDLEFVARQVERHVRLGITREHEHRGRRSGARRRRARPARRGGRVRQHAGGRSRPRRCRRPRRAGRTRRSSTTSTRCRRRPSPRRWRARPRRRCRSCRSPRRSTGRPRSRPGQVTIKDVAGLYIYDNTLLASILTGAQIKDYLEYSAKYFMQVAPDAPVDAGLVDERRQHARLQLRPVLGRRLRRRHLAAGRLAHRRASRTTACRSPPTSSSSSR